MNNPPSNQTTERLWFYADENNQPIGPIAFSELQALAKSGAIKPETYVFEQGGSGEWKKFLLVLREKRPLRWLAVACVLLLCPIGLIALWLSKGYSNAQKWIITGVTLGCFILATATGSSGFVFLMLITNSLLFTWWAETLNNVWKVAISVGICIFFLPPALMPTSESSPSGSSIAFSGSAPGQGSAKTQSNRLKIGEAFRLGDFTYQILNAQSQTSIGSSFGRAEAAPGALFLVVEYKIKNESNKTRTVMSDDFVLRDAQGREYRPSAKANTALLMAGDQQDFLVRELQPGLATQTFTAFETPADALYGQLTLIVPEKGWGMSKKEVLIQN